MGRSVRSNIIQSFWIGSIGKMERLCMKSYLAQGHEFHLYMYPNLVDQHTIPEGVIIKDANEIIPIQKVREFKWLQQGSDFFRVALLMKRGNWWVDLDTVCLRQFDFEDDYVFCDTPTARLVQNNPILVPGPDTPIMTAWYHWIATMPSSQKQRLPFQKIGPDQLGRIISQFGLRKYIKPLHVFDPVHWDRVCDVVRPNIDWDLSGSYAIHWFHGCWDNGSQARYHEFSPKTDGSYPADSLYEKMKRLYGV
jgi:hypothetical protein